MTGTAFAQRVENLLSRAGQRFGAGELRGTLTRVTGRSGPAWDPVDVTTTWDFVCIWGEFSIEERLAGLVKDGDYKLLIGAASLETEPLPGDKVTVDGAEYRVKAVDPVRPGGTALLYQATVRV